MTFIYLICCLLLSQKRLISRADGRGGGGDRLWIELTIAVSDQLLAEMDWTIDDAIHQKNSKWGCMHGKQSFIFTTICCDFNQADFE